MSATTVFTGRVFAVETETVSLPGGTRTKLDIIRHPPSVILLPILDDGRVVMIRQYRHAVKRVIWEVPAGNLDPGEAPESAAARECEEEIGLVPSRVEWLGSFYPVPGYCDEEMIFFRVSGLTPPPPDSPHRPDEDEDIQPHPMTPAEAKALLARGEIIDLKTAYALTLL
jgi:ADP-ribose pyrophosphatase